MRARGRRGFTIAELLVVLLVGGLLALAIARLADSVGRVGEANRAGSEARALEWAAERALRGALQEAGAAMPSSPNLSGVGVRTATAADGTPADTLIVLRAAGEALRVAARGCRTAAAACLVLVGDARTRLAYGDLLAVGTRPGGLRPVQVVEPPDVFFAPCGADCPEPLMCSVSPGEAQVLPRVVGSVRSQPGTPSVSPCPQAFFPDGSSCREIVRPIEVGARHEAECAAAVRTAAFTEVRFADRTHVLGFPAPPVPLEQSGGGGTPRARAVAIRASRFWTRADHALIRQNGLTPSGEWRTGVVLGAPVTGLQVETLHRGAWHRGAGVDQHDLLPSPSNPNYAWSAAPSASGREPGWRFLRGHHTIAAVRVRYLYGAATASHALPRDAEAWVVVDTRGLLDGGTGDVR